MEKDWHIANKVPLKYRENGETPFTGATGEGETQRFLDLLEGEYKRHIHNIIILFSSIR